MSESQTPEYHFRGSALEGPLALSLDGDKLVVRQGERPPRTLALSDVVRVRLWWQAERDGGDQFLCAVDFAKPGSPSQPFVTFGSRSHLSANHREARPKEYRGFVEALHRALLRSGTRAEFVVGDPRGSPVARYSIRLLFLAAAIFLVAKWMRMPTPLPLAAIAVVAAFGVSGLRRSMARNRAAPYDPEDLPARCLPAP